MNTQARIKLFEKIQVQVEGNIGRFSYRYDSTPKTERHSGDSGTVISLPDTTAPSSSSVQGDDTEHTGNSDSPVSIIASEDSEEYQDVHEIDHKWNRPRPLGILSPQ